MNPTQNYLCPQHGGSFTAKCDICGGTCDPITEPKEVQPTSPEKRTWGLPDASEHLRGGPDIIGEVEHPTPGASAIDRSGHYFDEEQKAKDNATGAQAETPRTDALKEKLSKMGPDWKQHAYELGELCFRLERELTANASEIAVLKTALTEINSCANFSDEFTRERIAALSCAALTPKTDL